MTNKTDINITISRNKLIGFAIIIFSILLLAIASFVIVQNFDHVFNSFKSILHLRSTKFLMAIPKSNLEYDVLLNDWDTLEDRNQSILRNVYPFMLQINPINNPALPSGQQQKDNSPGVLGVFPSGADDLYLWYRENSEYFLEKVDLDKENAKIPVFDTKVDNLSLQFIQENSSVMLVEQDELKGSCFIIDRDQKAQRLARGQSCYLLGDSSQVVQVTVNSKDEKSISLISLDGKSEKEIIDSMELDEFLFNQDGSKLIYVYPFGENQQKLVYFDVPTGKPIMESDPYPNIGAFGFSDSGDSLYFVSEAEDGMLTLYTLLTNEFVDIDVATNFTVQFSADGKKLVYSKPNLDGETELHVYDMLGNENSMLSKSEGELRFSVLGQPQKLLVAASNLDDDELRISLESLEGKPSLLLYNDLGKNLSVFFTEEMERLYFIFEVDEKQNLYTSSFTKADGFYMLEEWNEITLLGQNEKEDTLLVSAQEEFSDTPQLLAIPIIEDPSPLLLDDEGDKYYNAVFSPDGKEVMYSVSVDEILEVRKATADGKNYPETFLEEGLLLGTQWADLYPFIKLDGGWGRTISSSSYCPGATKLVLGESIEGVMSTQREPNCYLLDLKKDTHYVSHVISDVPVKISLYDEMGRWIQETPGGFEILPQLSFSVKEDGKYYMALFEPEFSGEDYLLQIYEGIGIDVFDFSDELITGVRVVGHITEEKSEIPNEIIKNISGHGFDYPGTLYKFRAEAGKTITINVYGPSIGSSLDPRVALFSPSLEFIKSDDDSGEGNDSKLTFTLTEPGFHYIYVHAAGNHGEESKYFYEVVWE